MKKIIKKPRSEKTTELIKISAETGNVIITANYIMAKCTFEMAKEMGLDIPYPMDICSFLNNKKNHMYNSEFNNVLVDNADWCLQQLFGNKTKIDIITMDEDYKEREPLYKQEPIAREDE